MASGDQTPRILTDTVSRAIKARRGELGLSQEDLALLCGLHRNTLGKIERGEAQPNILVLSALLISLGSTGVKVEEDGWDPLLYAPTSGIDARSHFRAMRAPGVIADIGRAIRAARRNEGISLEKLAAAADLHTNTLWSLESGLVVPSSATVHRVYRGLGVRNVTLGEVGLVLN
jgi:transcriptional regulator with XRE-family HTH domain